LKKLKAPKGYYEDYYKICQGYDDIKSSSFKKAWKSFVKKYGKKFTNLIAPLAEGSRPWTQLRTEVLKKAGFKCKKCGKRATLAHHKKMKSQYPALMFDIKNCVALCWICHQKIHGK
jgi:ribosomal protein L44E